MKKGKIILAFFVVLFIAAAVFGYREYTRKPADLTTVTTAQKSSAQDLVKMFELDEQKANDLYLGKTVDISGTITTITSQNDTLINVMLGESDSMHHVSCLLDANHKDDIKKFKEGDPVTIRGICTGYLMDVELNRCVIIP